MWDMLHTEIKKIDNWTKDLSTVMSNFMAVLMPDVRHAINKLYKPIVDSEAKYSADVVSDANAGKVKEIITGFADASIKSIETMLLTEGDRLTQSYYVEVMTLHSTTVTVDVLRDINAFPMYKIKTNFMLLCNDMLDVVQSRMSTTGNNMRRVLDVYDDDLFDIVNMPSEYVHVIFPFKEMIYDAKYNELKTNGKDGEFLGYLVGDVDFTSKQMAADIMAQLMNVRTSLAFAIGSCELLTDAMKKDLLISVDFVIQDAQKKLNREVEGTAFDMKRELPDKIDVKEFPYYKAVAVAQNNGDEAAKEMNMIGRTLVNQLVYMYEMVSQLDD